jgi:hypothetical protein
MEVNLLKLKKLLIRCSATFLLLMCLSTAFSHEYAVLAAEKASYTEDGGAVIQAEQTEWRYRVVDGKLQKRLWSITYGIWLTDWEWV